MRISQQNVRMSPRVKKEMRASTSQVKRKSQNSNTPDRKSDTAKKVLPSSIVSKQAPVINGPPHLKRKEEKLLSSVLMESGKAEPDVEVTGLKRRKLTAREFIFICKKQHTEATTSMVPCENPFLPGICILCTKNRRIGYGSPGQELCSCCPSVNKHAASEYKIRSMKVKSKNQSPDETYTGEQIRDDSGDGSEIDAKIKMLQHECDKRMNELTQKHKEEIQEFHRMWEEERLKMDKRHKLDSALIRVQGSIQKMPNNLGLLESRFANKMKLHNLQKDRRLKELEAKQLAAVQVERKNALYLLGKAKSASTELRSAIGPTSDGSRSEDDAGVPQLSTSQTPIKNLASVNSYDEFGAGAGSLLPMNGRPNQLENSIDNEKPIFEKVTLVEQHCDEVQPVFRRQDFPTDAATSVPNEVDPRACSVESSNTSEGKEYVTALADELVRLGDRPEAASVVLQRPGQNVSIWEKEPTRVGEHSDEMQPVVPKDDFPAEAAMSIPNEVNGQTCSVESSNASETGSDKECDTALLDDSVRPRDAPEASIVVFQEPTQNIAISENVPTHVEAEQHSDKIQPVVEVDDFPTQAAMFVPNEVVDHACSGGSNNASETGFGKECDATWPDDLVILGDRPEETSVVLQRLGQTLVHSRPNVAMQDSSESLPQQVQEQSSAALHLLDSFVAEIPRASGLSDDVVTMPSNLEVPLVDENVIHVPANDEALLIENMVHLHSVSIKASISHPSPANDLDPGRSSSQTAEPGTTETCSPSRGNPEMHHQSPSLIGVLPSRLSDSIISSPSNLQAPVSEGTETPSSEAPVTENSEQLLSAQAKSSLSQNPFLATEYQGRILPLTMESGWTEVISGESCSPSRGNMEVFHTQPDLQPACYVTLGQDAELSSISRSNVAMHQTVTSSGGPNQAVLPIGTSFSNSHVPNSVFYNRHDLQPFAMSAPSWPADPLQTELEKMREKIADLKKNQENMIPMLRSDCQKEIQETVAEIRNRYEMKQQYTDAEFKLKEDELSKKRNKIIMNRILSKTLRYNCLEHPPSGHPIQGILSTSMQQLHQISMPSLLSQPPFPRQQITAARPVESVQKQPGTLSGISSSVTEQSGAPPSLQVVQHPAALFSSTSPRSPIIATVTPGEIRSQTRHLQPFRMSSPRVIPPTSSSVSLLQPQQIQPSVSGVQSFRWPAPPVRHVTSASAARLQPVQMPPSAHVQTPQLLPHLSNFASGNRARSQQMTPSWTLRSTLPQGQRPPSINLVSVNRPEVQGGVPAATLPPS